MEYKKIIAAVGITAASAASAFIGYSIFGGELEKIPPVIKPLSEERISEVGYTVIPQSEASDISEDERSETASSAAKAVFPLDINAATAEELSQIKGIGSVTAQNIVDYRESRGYFYSFEDLLNVSGIGEKKLENMIPFIFIDGALPIETTAAAADLTAAVSSVTELVKESETEQTAVTEVYPEEEYCEDEELDEEYEIFGGGTEFEFTETAAFSETEYYPAFPLELNSASAEDLAYINGIGSALAQKIVEYARTYGFYEIEELLNVSGIGESKLQSIAPYVYADSRGLPPRADTEYDPFEPLPFTDNDYGETAARVYRININTADKADFLQLPKIDEATADNLIKLREDVGGFEKIEELIFAEGMTSEKLATIWDYVYI